MTLRTMLDQAAFLNATSGTDLARYVQRYLSGEASTVKTLSTGQLARLAHEAKLGPAQALADYFPRLPGERVHHASLQTLECPWHDLPAGTLVYRRTTNLGTIAFPIPTVAPADMPVAERAAFEASGDTTIIDATLTMAQFVGFAIGPAGLILAGGAVGLQMIFHKLLADQYTDIPLSRVVQRILDNELTAEELRESLAAFKITYGWFKEYYDQAWSDDDAIGTQEFEEFTRNLSEALGPNSRFLFYLSLLMEPKYAVSGFSAFLMGATLHGVLLKIDLILKSSKRPIIDTPALDVLINYLGTYVDQANDTVTEINQQINDRLGKVTSIEQDGSRYAFTDKGTQTDLGGKPTVYRYDDKMAAEVGREAMLIKLQAELNQQYYHGRPDKVQATIQQWEDSKKAYEKYKRKDND